MCRSWNLQNGVNFTGNFTGGSKKAGPRGLAFSVEPFDCKGFSYLILVPLIRIERMTYCLQDSCSTD